MGTSASRRMAVPALAGAAIVIALALVWFFQPEPPPTSTLDEAGALPVPAARPLASSADARSAGVDTPAVAGGAPAVGDPPAPQRSPLPGEAPTTPMTQALADFQQNQNREPGGGIPPEMAEGEREFAAEPIDGRWAPGAEANLLSTFAQVPGLELIDLQVHCRSTMCRVQLTQPFVSRGPGVPPFKIHDAVSMEPRWTVTVADGPAPARPPQPGDPPLLMKSIGYFWRDGLAPERDTNVGARAN